MWKATFDVYVDDKHKLGMKDFFEKSSPYAYQDMSARMVETVRKGYWNADAAVQKKLIQEYVESVNRHGASGAENTTGNARLSKFVMDRGKELGIPVPALDGFKQVMEKAMGGSVAETARTIEDFVARNDAPAAMVSNVPAPLQGYVMNVSERTPAAAKRTPAAIISGGDWDSLWIGLPILGLLFAWRWRRRA
jgi:cobalamin biosynthesis Mg chelatase CobN